ncbi:MAG TPA: sensor domain-containing protein [Phycisphaerales bacterium]|nr:sensor domain-containing protein [Phycisphaerales bacterium]
MNAAASDPLPRPDGGTPTQAISRYLSQLAVAAVGLDAAMVNDILADAEQHLWNAVGEGVPVDRAIADFGEPRDVVTGYVEAEALRGRGRKAAVPLATIAGGQVVAAARPSQKRGLEAMPVIGVWGDRHAWGSLVLFIVGFGLATAYFAVVVSWASLSLGLIAMIIGLPMLVALLGFCRVLTLGHGRVIEILTGVRMPRRTAPVAGTGMASFWGRIVLWLKDARSWLSVAYLLGNFPVAVALFAVFVSLVSTSAALMFAPIAELFMPDEWFENGNGFHFLGWQGGRMPAALGVLSFLLGLVLATGTLWLAKGSGWLYAQVAKAIQVSRPVPAVPVQVC